MLQVLLICQGRQSQSDASCELVLLAASLTCSHDCDFIPRLLSRPLSHFTQYTTKRRIEMWDRPFRLCLSAFDGAARMISCLSQHARKTSMTDLEPKPSQQTTEQVVVMVCKPEENTNRSGQCCKPATGCPQIPFSAQLRHNSSDIFAVADGLPQ